MSSSSVAEPAADPSSGDPARRPRALLVLVAACVVVLVVAVGLAVALSAGSSKPDPGGAPAPPGVSTGGVATKGSMAPDFTLPVLDSDQTVTLSELRNTTVVLNFWASWCTPCREEFPDLREFQATHPQARVLGIIYQDNLTDARDFARSQNATWPLLVDKASATALAYGVRAIPQSFVIGPDGVIKERIFGTLTDEKLAQLTAG